MMAHRVGWHFDSIALKSEAASDALAAMCDVLKIFMVDLSPLPSNAVGQPVVDCSSLIAKLDEEEPFAAAAAGAGAGAGGPAGGSSSLSFFDELLFSDSLPEMGFEEMMELGGPFEI